MGAWMVLWVVLGVPLVGGFGFVLWKIMEKLEAIGRREATPALVAAVPAGAGHPPESWWEQLQAIQSQMANLRLDVETHLARATNEKTLARNAEERTRKMIARHRLDEGEDPEEVDPAQFQLEPPQSNWEPEEPVRSAPAVTNDAVRQLLNQRRGR